MQNKCKNIDYKQFKTQSFLLKIQKKYRGMSTKEVQKKWGNTQLKTSEGVTRYFDVEYTLEQWTQNFMDYLKSAMSYTNSINLEELRMLAQSGDH